MIPVLVLKPGREKSLRRRHPWIFSGAVARAPKNAVPGETVEVHAADGEFLALAAYNPKSQITARVWDWARGDIGPDFFRQRVARAAALRAALSGVTEACRLVHGEADGLPGVIADRFGSTVVLQLLTAGAMRWREAIADALAAVPGVTAVYERSEADVLALEGLQPSSGVLRGPAPAAGASVLEHGLRFEYDAAHGQKTGFYLDQRDNRLRLREWVRAQNVQDVLDCFCYTGGFGINALAGGAAAVSCVDSSGPALEQLRRNAALNGLPAPECVEADAFQHLRALRDRQARYDLIVLDPPKFAPTAAHAERAARAYKDINLLAFKLLRPGGTLFTFSCSGGVSRELFQKIVAGAALDAGVHAQIAAYLGAGSDHPVALNFPESEYLKGLVCRLG